MSASHKHISPSADSGNGNTHYNSSFPARVKDTPVTKESVASADPPLDRGMAVQLERRKSRDELMQSTAETTTSSLDDNVDAHTSDCNETEVTSGDLQQITKTTEITISSSARTPGAPTRSALPWEDSADLDLADLTEIG
ncbi:uncharacterized protein I206_101941 [Kwoniella pini CBS 10737]|uniref:Uncharacterized protein n=1 Tax=Kwoniella pini CBS 10737 TaxID=1296096 RepID=A0A1B9HV95_9TREE|nr:uncharacterized protein I206_06968 [Kwoniella pini CBS 10737]OCF47190.1 hypothetical protein I206_06968 [Kwoniella pini CBS 10737]